MQVEHAALATCLERQIALACEGEAGRRSEVAPRMAACQKYRHSGWPLRGVRNGGQNSFGFGRNHHDRNLLWRLRLQGRALFAAEHPAVRALLPLPLVPARNRFGVRDERADRKRARAVAGPRAGTGATPSASGKGQKIARCPQCRIALWSHYAGGGDIFTFIRVGTLDDPDRFPPDIHIFTMSKQPWVILSDDVPAMREYYEREKYWPKESLERRTALLAKH